MAAAQSHGNQATPPAAFEPSLKLVPVARREHVQGTMAMLDGELLEGNYGSPKVVAFILDGTKQDPAELGPFHRCCNVQIGAQFR